MTFTLKDWQRLLRRVTYKPNVTFSVVRRELPFPYAEYEPPLMLKVCQILTDAVDPDNGEAPVTFMQEVPPYIEDEKHALLFLRSCIERSELHEIDEWLRHDGKYVRHPHPDSPEHKRRETVRDAKNAAVVNIRRTMEDVARSAVIPRHAKEADPCPAKPTS